MRARNGFREAPPFDEDAYWRLLESRVDFEIRYMLDERVQGFWCDGLAPLQYLLSSRQPRIIGNAYLGKTGQERWELTLLLPRHVKCRETIDWAAHFPPWNVTRWVSLDFKRLRIEIDPAAAVPDLKVREC